MTSPFIVTVYCYLVQLFLTNNNHVRSLLTRVTNYFSFMLLRQFELHQSTDQIWTCLMNGCYCVVHCTVTDINRVIQPDKAVYIDKMMKKISLTACCSHVHLHLDYPHCAYLEMFHNVTKALTGKKALLIIRTLGCI